jgi:hypothetical protein
MIKEWILGFARSEKVAAPYVDGVKENVARIQQGLKDSIRDEEISRTRGAVPRCIHYQCGITYPGVVKELLRAHAVGDGTREADTLVAEFPTNITGPDNQKIFFQASLDEGAVFSSVQVNTHPDDYINLETILLKP